MPRVPYTGDSTGNVRPMLNIDPTTYAMAAGMMYQEGKLFEAPDMTDKEFEGAFTPEYSQKTQEKGHTYEPTDAEGIKKHMDDIGEGFFRQDQKGMDQFLKEHGDAYEIKRTPQEGNGKRGYYLRQRLMM